MNRRSWVVALSALTAMPGFALTAMRRSDDLLPWPTFSVAGRRALAEWERLRAIGAGYPVILGTRDDVARLAEHLDYDDRVPIQIVLASEAYDFPAQLHMELESQSTEVQARYRDNPDMRPDVILVDINGRQRAQTAEEWDAEVERMADGPALGEWPRDALANRAASFLMDGQTGAFHREVFIVVLPTQDP